MYVFVIKYIYIYEALSQYLGTTRFLGFPKKTPICKIWRYPGTRLPVPGYRQILRSRMSRFLAGKSDSRTFITLHSSK